VGRGTEEWMDHGNGAAIPGLHKAERVPLYPGPGPPVMDESRRRDDEEQMRGMD